MKYELSKKGVPCIWEKGGSYTNKGSATLIADNKFLAKTPLYVKRSGMLACAEHALIPVRKGDRIVEISHHRGDFTIVVYAIQDIKKELELKEINRFDRGEWDFEFDNDNFKNLIDAAKRKVRAYHCRTPYYIKVED